ncbi:DotI/IcmL/TraM family protein [Vibrio sp. 947]|uniref:DotI/IcmL/TraM family protein n=1 Tax=unclassified Vibrio TaxID=2614977 RepID=UPI0029644660|nr:MULTISPECIES: DotI/IcmL/TraM family protein [unclassified Vibrio]MDW1582283.1 DotI/IcmL/TraM family protein [Vibrio sp. Vb2897]MDW1640544.1 DotI/IcmL/TraM family protein [Vibrio sp. Vb2896]MDW1925927.1 DotI/IcmL/TraM family protein [Vibrio sp. 947]
MNNKTPKKSKPVKQVAVAERREFYKDAHASLVKLAVTSVVCLVVSVGLAIYSHSSTTKNVYFAATNDGRMVKMVALNTPNQKDANVSAWVQEAIIETFDMNFHNMKSQIAKSSMKWFTQSGGEALVQSLDSEGYFDTIIRNKLIVAFAPTHTPVITKKFYNSSTGKYTWHLQMEGLLTYRTQTKVYSDTVVFAIEVERISLREDPKGMGISKIILRKK